MSVSLRSRIPATVLSSALIALLAIWLVSAWVFYLTNRDSKDRVFGAPVWALLFLTLVPLSTLLLAPWLIRARRGQGERLRVIDYYALAAGMVPFGFVGLLLLTWFATR